MSSLLLSYPARYFAAWNDRDIDRALAVVSADVQWSDPSLPRGLTDREQARAFFEGSWAAFPDLAFTAISSPLLDESTGRVSQEWRMTGTDSGAGFAGRPPGGRSFDIVGSDVWTVAESGEASSVAAYYDAAEFARQLGAQ